MKIGLIGAIKEEVFLLKDELHDLKAALIGTREFYSGTIAGHEVVVGTSGWGKVAAASTATSLINLYHVDHLLFIGLAGSMQDYLEIGDIIVANKLIQHDVYLSVLTDVAVELPSRKNFEFEVLSAAWHQALTAGNQFINNLKEQKYPAISEIYHPRIYVGTIATGDQFVATTEGKKQISQRFPDVLCVEMEGAAIAQVAADYGIPCSVIRIISDQADEAAHQNFTDFLFSNISYISVEIAKLMFISAF
jgi:adenosylhomocysteine nucleosidase